MLRTSKTWLSFEWVFKFNWFSGAGRCNPKCSQQSRWVSPFSSLCSTHLVSLASCLCSRGPVCFFHNSTVTSLWKLSTWGSTPTSGKMLLSELIRREQPSLSISLACPRTGPGAPVHSHTGTHQGTVRRAGGKAGERAEEESLKTPNRDWNALCCCAISPSIPEKALPLPVTINTGRLHGNPAIWHKSVGREIAPMADNSLNNYIFPFMCYQNEKVCAR